MFKPFIIVLSLLLFAGFAQAQNNKPYVRIAKIVVDSAQLDSYKSQLKTGMETAVKLEPGVLSMYAVYDNQFPTHITILETYASKEAYQSHIQTSHFKKYKSGTLSMVKSLELTDVTPIAYEAKMKK
jgi:quinol monooxygenase YgiN